MEEQYKVKDIKKLKEDLEKLSFVSLDVIEKTGEFLAFDNRVKKRWDKFWSKDWLCQVLQDKITDDFWLCFNGCNKFKSLSLEEIFSFIKILTDNTK